MSFVRLIAPLMAALLLTAGAFGPGAAQGTLTHVLWWNGMVDSTFVTSSHQEKMAQYLGNFGNGRVFRVEYRHSTRGGALAAHLDGKTYDILVLNVTDRRRRLNQADMQAIQTFYASGRRALMLDGSLAIRSATDNPTTDFPGQNGASGALLVNQIAALADAGGGILIGADHQEWQVNSNAALAALLPGARFSGTTNPSTDGDFLGDVLLGLRAEARPVDLLRHWESIPNQGEAPVGTFTDFTGQPVTLHALVEAADKPGGGPRRPYISASFDPGDKRTRINSAESVFENLPTHKSP